MVSFPCWCYLDLVYWLRADMEPYPNLRRVGSPESYQVKYHFPSSKFVLSNLLFFDHAIAMLKMGKIDENNPVLKWIELWLLDQCMKRRFIQKSYNDATIFLFWILHHGSFKNNMLIKESGPWEKPFSTQSLIVMWMECSVVLVQYMWKETFEP